MATQQTDLLQKFIDNEKKSKTWTFISVLIFAILGGIIIYQASRLKQNETRLIENEKLLSDALEKADEHKSSFENASNSAVFYKTQYDSLLAKINLPTTHPRDIVNNIVFIQYTEAFTDDSKLVYSLLRRHKYNAPGTELLRKGSFTSSVKYFNDSDKAAAEKIASLINSNIARFKRNNIRILKNNLNVPTGQLEVWLGEGRKLQRGELLDKYRQAN